MRAIIWLAAGLAGGFVVAVVGGAFLVAAETLLGRVDAEDAAAVANILSALAALAVAASVVVAYRQWSEEQIWKRREWMRQFTRGFQDTPGARNACLILATDGREVPIFDHPEPQHRYRAVTWGDVERALLPQAIKPLSVCPLHTAIRDSFDDFLSRLAALEFILKAGRLELEDVRPGVHEWIRVIGRRDVDLPHIRALRLYIDEHEHRAFQELFLRFGVDLVSGLDKDRAAARAGGHSGQPASTSAVRNLSSTSSISIG